MTRQRTGALLIPRSTWKSTVAGSRAFKPLNAQVLFAVRALAQRINDDATERLGALGLTPGNITTLGDLR